MLPAAIASSTPSRESPAEQTPPSPAQAGDAAAAEARAAEGAEAPGAGPPASPPPADPLVELARRLTTPVDVEALVAEGVLRPRRRWARRWYQVLDVVRLPEWARCRIVAMHADPDGPLVRFARPNPAVRRLLEELTGERPPSP
jgi:hypothetical protein